MTCLTYNKNKWFLRALIILLYIIKGNAWYKSINGSRRRVKRHPLVVSR